MELWVISLDHPGKLGKHLEEVLLHHLIYWDVTVT